MTPGRANGGSPGQALAIGDGFSGLDRHHAHHTLENSDGFTNLKPEASKIIKTKIFIYQGCDRVMFFWLPPYPLQKNRGEGCFVTLSKG
jgi:hypothetical protein